jgi:hypothetical protein
MDARCSRDYSNSTDASNSKDGSNCRDTSYSKDYHLKQRPQMQQGLHQIVGKLAGVRSKETAGTPATSGTLAT